MIKTFPNFAALTPLDDELVIIEADETEGGKRTLNIVKQTGVLHAANLNAKSFAVLTTGDTFFADFTAANDTLITALPGWQNVGALAKIVDNHLSLAAGSGSVVWNTAAKKLNSKISFMLKTMGAADVSIVFRLVDGQNFYRAIMHSGNGYGFTCMLRKVVNGAEIDASVRTFVPSDPGTAYDVTLKVEGETFTLTIGNHPSIIFTGDGTFKTEGFVGLSSYGDGGAGRFVDNFKVEPLGYTPPPPPPETTPIKKVLIIGQSLAEGIGGQPALTTVQPYNNRMFAGGIHQPAPYTQNLLVKLCEGRDETIASAMANMVSYLTRLNNPNDDSQDLVVSNWARGGQPYSELKKGTQRYAESIAAVQSLVNLVNPRPVIVPGIANVHGESDGWKPDYQQVTEQWQRDYQADIKAITGQTVDIPMFNSQTSSLTLYAATGISPYAMLAAHEANPMLHVLVCAKYFLPHDADGVHLPNFSYRKLGQYYGKAWYKRIVKGEQYNPLRPVSQTLSGKVITIVFAGNVGALVFDETLVSNPGNYGFEYYDESQSADIDDIKIKNNTVEIILNQTPTGNNKRVRYAFTGIQGNGGGPTTGARGNLRDSDTTTAPDTPNDYLYNWAVHFDKQIN